MNYKNFTQYFLIFSLLFFWLAVISVSAQNITLTGRVLDEKTQEGLPGASLHIKGTTHGISTNADGNFTFVTRQSFPTTLIVTYIGYKIQEVTINNNIPVTISLVASENTKLNEIVVVGYGRQERKNLIGSVSKIDPSETKNIPAGSFDAQLQGKVPGVQISSNTGVPGEAVNIRIRGAASISVDSDPLYIIDGVFINNNSLQTIGTGGKATSPIADINPSDIESIEILKDAEATAIYGSRGANGVVLVTTKRGSFGQKAKITFNTSQGWAKAAKLWDLTTGPEHATLVNEWWANTGGSFATRPFRPVAEGGRGLPEEQKTYDRLSQLFRTAKLQNYDLALQGGSESTRYYIGGSYNKQEAIIKPVYFERASFKLNLDQKVNDRIQVGVSNMFTRGYRNQARAGDGPQGGLLQAALHTPTYLSPYNDQGVLVGRAGFDNLELLINNYDVHTVSLRYIGNLYVEAEILPNLKFKTSWGVDYNNYNESEYWNTFLLLGASGGLATSSITQYTSLLNEQTLSYRKNLGDKHSFGVLIGNTLQSDVSARTFTQGTGFPNNDYKIISSASTITGTQNWTKFNLASFFSRVDYSFDSKYLVDFTFRADGSSKFGASNKWGYFPAVGAAWRIKQEGFLRDFNFISDLKLRTSYGFTGNQAGINNFASQGLWSGGTGYQGVAGIAPLQLGNPNLKWERTRQFNVGLDASFFNNRLTLEANYYNKYTTNVLLQLSQPATSGFSTYWSNAAEISNKGFEFSLSTVNIRSKGILWTTNFNVAQNINKIEKLATPLKYGSRDLILLKQGSSLYSFWVYKQLSVNSETGDAVYEDVNKDGKRTVDDRQIYGSIWPKFFGGITNNVSYKGFDLNVFFSFQYGNKIYNHNRFFGEAGGARDAARVIFKSDLKRWQKPGDVTDVPRTDGINVNNYLDGGSRWLEDGSFLRLRSLTLGYTIPKKVTDSAKIQSVRFYVTGTNLLLFTKYTGADPESSSSSDQNQQGIDLGTPPQPRGVQIGLSVTL